MRLRHVNRFGLFVLDVYLTFLHIVSRFMAIWTSMTSFPLVSGSNRIRLPIFMLFNPDTFSDVSLILLHLFSRIPLHCRRFFFHSPNPYWLLPVVIVATYLVLVGTNSFLHDFKLSFCLRIVFDVPNRDCNLRYHPTRSIIALLIGFTMHQALGSFCLHVRALVINTHFSFLLTHQNTCLFIICYWIYQFLKIV